MFTAQYEMDLLKKRNLRFVFKGLMCFGPLYNVHFDIHKCECDWTSYTIDCVGTGCGAMASKLSSDSRSSELRRVDVLHLAQCVDQCCFCCMSHELLIHSEVPTNW